MGIRKTAEENGKEKNSGGGGEGRGEEDEVKNHGIYVSHCTAFKNSSHCFAIIRLDYLLLEHFSVIGPYGNYIISIRGISHFSHPSRCVLKMGVSALGLMTCWRANTWQHSSQSTHCWSPMCCSSDYRLLVLTEVQFFQTLKSSIYYTECCVYYCL